MPTVTIWHATWCAPCKGTIERIVGLCGWGSLGREAPPARPRRDDAKGTVTKAEPQGRDMRGQGV